jgi:hypothetical protein
MVHGCCGQYHQRRPEHLAPVAFDMTDQFVDTRQVAGDFVIKALPNPIKLIGQTGEAGQFG